MPITHHTDLINALIEKYNLQNYLEIGINDPSKNFDLIRCKIKAGVDPKVSGLTNIIPVTSDIFFEKETELKWDIIFIDGYHESSQVKRDFENSMKVLNDNGFILIHDVCPKNEAGTKVPRETKVWWGDVYKFAMTMHEYGYEYKTFNIDNGCMLVQKTPLIRPIHPANVKYDWETFKMYKHVLLRIVDEVVI